MSMTTTPLDLPASGPGKQDFEIQVVSGDAPENGGALGSIQVGAPRWVAVYTLGTLSRELSDEWRAVTARLRGMGKWFYGRDYQRPYPKACPAGFTGMTRHGGGAFDGSATSWSQSIDGEGNCTVQLDGLPDGFVLGFGDYIGFKWNTTRRALVRAVGLSVDIGSGSITVMVEPPVPVVTVDSGGVVPSDATAYLNEPTCLMKRAKGDAALGGVDRRGAVTAGVITGVQDLQP